MIVYNNKHVIIRFKGTQVVVSHCFRKNVNVTCKIVSFLCSLDNFLLKNVIVFFFGNQISKWRSIEKGLLLTYFSHSLVTRETTETFLQHTSYLHTRILLTLLTFLPSQFCEKKNANSSYIVSLWCDSWC